MIGAREGRERGGVDEPIFHLIDLYTKVLLVTTLININTTHHSFSFLVSLDISVSPLR